MENNYTNLTTEKLFSLMNSDPNFKNAVANDSNLRLAVFQIAMHLGEDYRKEISEKIFGNEKYFDEKFSRDEENFSKKFDAKEFFLNEDEEKNKHEKDRDEEKEAEKFTKEQLEFFNRMREQDEKFNNWLDREIENATGERKEYLKRIQAANKQIDDDFEKNRAMHWQQAELKTIHDGVHPDNPKFEKTVEQNFIKAKEDEKNKKFDEIKKDEIAKHPECKAEIFEMKNDRDIDTDKDFSDNLDGKTAKTKKNELGQHIDNVREIIGTNKTQEDKIERKMAL